MRGATVLLKVSATAWALWSAGQAYGQCADTTTTLWYETTAVRMNGNAVRLNGQTRITGDYYNWWYTEADAAFYFNNTREDLSGWYHSNTLGGGTGSGLYAYVADLRRRPVLPEHGTRRLYSGLHLRRQLEYVFGHVRGLAHPLQHSASVEQLKLHQHFAAYPS